MALCRYCNQNAGWLSDFHKSCEESYRHGQDKIRRWVYDCVAGVPGAHVARPQDLPGQVATVARACHISHPEVATLVAEGWGRAFDTFLSHGIPEQAVLDRLDCFAKLLEIPPQELERLGVRQKLAKVRQDQLLQKSKSDLLFALERGRTLIPPAPPSDLPILFQKNETFLWHFAGVRYAEEKTTKETVRQSQGVGYRGYYRGESRSHVVEHTDLVIVDRGRVALTDKNLYFAGPAKTFKLPLVKIVGMHPYRDALEVVKEAATPKRQVFLDMDGTFAAAIIKAATGHAR